MLSDEAQEDEHILVQRDYTAVGMAAVAAVHIVAVSMTVVGHNHHNSAVDLVGEIVVVAVESMATAGKVVGNKGFDMGCFAADMKTAAAVIAVNPATVGADMLAAGKRLV